MKPGIYNIPAEEYHKAAGVSKSMLDHLERSPAHFKAHQEAPKEPTPAMVMGTIVHTAILEPHKPRGFHVVPSGVDGRNKAGKEWYAAHVDLPCIDAEENAGLRGMVNSVARHPLASVIMEGGQNEMSVFAMHEATATLRRSRPDKITKDSGGNPTIVDLKTTDDASYEAFAKTVVNFRYHVQQAFYQDCFEALTGQKPYFLFVVVERKPPYAVACYELERGAVEYGRACYESNLATYAKCVKTNKWPAYSEEIKKLALPSWAFKGTEQYNG